MSRTPITLITGPLGSGKTTLLRHILAIHPAKIAIVMNEFGEIAIDTKVIEGKNVRIAELETTGLAEPEALVFNIQEALPQCRLDGVISVIDADMLVRFPELGHTTRLQIQGADILLLNKVDLVEPAQIEPLETKLHKINPTAAIVRTDHCRMDPELLFGIPQLREKKVSPPKHRHHLEFEWFTFSSKKTLSRDCFERFADSLPGAVIRAKGFVRFADGAHLFNFVVGRWDLEPFESDSTELVFIGKKIAAEKSAILCALDECTEPDDK